MLVNMILFGFCVYGIATIISSEYLLSFLIDKFKDHHNLYYFLNCNKCLSVWIGFIVSLLGFGIINPIVDPFIAYTFTVIVNKLTTEN